VFEGTAHTPNFWNLIEEWSWAARTGGSRSYCFWKPLCNLPGDLAWTSVRDAGDGSRIGPVGCKRATMQNACLSERLWAGACAMRFPESSLPGVLLRLGLCVGLSRLGYKVAFQRRMFR
jgi:hypothetical protein